MNKRILAVASGGGHWQQLMAMRGAFEGHDVLYLTTFAGLPEEYGLSRAAIIPDCSRQRRIQAIRCLVALATHLLRHRPSMVVSTGALPGVLALALGRMIGARTVWIDSVANAEEMSMSGMLARRFSTLWLSQWEHVAQAHGAEFAGRIL